MIDGTLTPAETWETKVTPAGVAADSDDAVTELKKEAWDKLVKARKLGYFALLRNLRNILQLSPELVDELVAQLTDESLIRKSLVLPFRFITATEALQETNLPRVSVLLAALSDAVISR